MNFLQIRTRARRIVDLGPRATALVVRHRVQNLFFGWYWREKACARHAHHAWHTIMLLHGLKGSSEQEFTLFFAACARTSYSFLDVLCPLDAHDMRIIDAANEYVNNTFSILGSRKQRFENLPWHTDIRLQEQDPDADCSFDPSVFYKDIVIETGTQENLLKDIKVPWELSRMQHLPVMARAYCMTKDEQYASAFMDHVSDWTDKNPFMLGVNWVCPMEVGIRAVNLVVAYAWLRDEPSITTEFWSRFACLLYDHLWYLENNWEIYDTRTSNHYLSDLIGYYYLCYFFSSLPGMSEKMAWCHQELLREFDKQIFDEGVSYESSTGYHRLVAEIFYHFFLLSNQASLPLPTRFNDGISRMIDAVGWFSYAVRKPSALKCELSYVPLAQQIVHIGDLDSGCLLFTGLPDSLFHRIHMQSVIGGIHFPRAGISVIKKDGWHVTLRHHAYESRQPSSHQHNDVTSLTLAANGIPIIVDPGSYVYTPSIVWRNRFRSAAAHNGFFIDGHEPVSLSNAAFAFGLSAGQDAGLCDASESVATTHHDLYARFGLRAQRTVRLDVANGLLMVSDWWYARGYQYHGGMIGSWGFTLAPGITAHNQQGHVWLFKRDNQSLLYCESKDLHFSSEETWASCQYGKKVPTIRLVARMPIVPDKKMCVIFKKI